MVYCSCCSSVVVKIVRAWLPSVLWCCWSGSRKGIRRVKTERWGAGMVICLERGADLQMAQLMLLPLTVSCFSKIRIGFTFLVPAHPGSPGKGPLNRCVCSEVLTFVFDINVKVWTSRVEWRALVGCVWRRSDTPLIYRAVPSWFVRVEHMVDKLLASNSLTYWSALH